MTYQEMLSARNSYIQTDRKANYPGTLTEETVEEVVEKELYLSDLWSEWAEETGYEFDNIGSECCPEYEYPDVIPFQWA